MGYITDMMLCAVFSFYVFFRVFIYIYITLWRYILLRSGADTGFWKRGGTSKCGHKTAGGGSRGAVSPPSGVRGKAPEAFATQAFTSTRIANTSVIIASDFAL